MKGVLGFSFLVFLGFLSKSSRKSKRRFLLVGVVCWGEEKMEKMTGPWKGRDFLGVKNEESNGWFFEVFLLV